MTIPDATEDDYERDAAEEYEYYRISADYVLPWIRRAVIAERNAERLERHLDDVWAKAREMMAVLSGDPIPQTATPEPRAES